MRLVPHAQSSSPRRILRARTAMRFGEGSGRSCTAAHTLCARVATLFVGTKCASIVLGLRLGDRVKVIKSLLERASTGEVPRWQDRQRCTRGCGPRYAGFRGTVRVAATGQGSRSPRNGSHLFDMSRRMGIVWAARLPQ